MRIQLNHRVSVDPTHPSTPLLKPIRQPPTTPPRTMGGAGDLDGSLYSLTHQRNTGHEDRDLSLNPVWEQQWFLIDNVR